MRRRRILAMLAAVLMALTPARASEALTVPAKGAVLIDAESGRILFAQNANEMLRFESEEDVQRLYTLFCARQEESIRDMISMRSELIPALDCAIFSSSYRAGCECMLHSVPEADEAEEASQD